MTYDCLDYYGRDADPFGVEQLSDTELMAREQLLRSDLASMQRSFARYEEFTEQADLAALGEHGVWNLHDNAAGLDWSIEADERELAAVSAERACRAEAEANAGADEPAESAWWTFPD